MYAVRAQSREYGGDKVDDPLRQSREPNSTFWAGGEKKRDIGSEVAVRSQILRVSIVSFLL